MRHVSVAELYGGSGGITVREAAHTHLLKWLRNPDPGSPFEKKTRYLRWLPDSVLLYLLRMLRYDGLMFLHNERDEIVGHVFFQKHADGLHLFSAWLAEDQRGKGSAISMIQQFLLYAWESGCKDVRMGTDRNQAMSRLRERVFNARLNLPFTLIPGQNGWAKLAA